MALSVLPLAGGLDPGMSLSAVAQFCTQSCLGALDLNTFATSQRCTGQVHLTKLNIHSLLNSMLTSVVLVKVFFFSEGVFSSEVVVFL